MAFLLTYAFSTQAHTAPGGGGALSSAMIWAEADQKVSWLSTQDYSPRHPGGIAPSWPGVVP